MVFSAEILTDWGYLDTAICGSANYKGRELRFSCGLAIDDKVWKELSARDTEMVNHVHRRHHEANHDEEVGWRIIVASEEGEDWYKLTFVCSCAR